MHTALMNLVSFSPKFIDALNPVPYEQPQSTPFPARKSSAAWAALWPDLGWLLFVGAMALGCGAGGMWWLTGGAR
jgi:hypothetical protein